MKCTIIYFSQTGNTEQIAKTIQVGVKQAAGNCDLLKIKEISPRRLSGYDLLGLGSPVLGYQEPDNVIAFIKDMRFVGGKHIFVFATHGTRPEFFFPSIVPRLKRRGLVVIGTYSCYATMLGSPTYPTAGHPDTIDLKEAAAFGRDMVARSQRIAAGETGLIPGTPKAPPPGSAERYKKERQAEERKLGIPETRATRQSLIRYDKEKCRYPRCQLCMENCPMDGIDLTVEPPVMAKPCMNCSFCARICPTGAITSGMGSVKMPKALEKVMHTELFEKHYLAPLAQAEAEGRFRRLIPIEKTTGIQPMDPNKHPQWIIGKGRA